MAHERGQSEQNALNKAFSDPAQSFNTVMKGFDGANYPALSVEADGSLNVNAALGDLTLDTVPYGITYGPLTDSGYFYLAYQDGTGAWYMKRQNTTTYAWQYVKGTSDIATNWGNRASLTWTDYDTQNGIETATGVLGNDVHITGDTVGLAKDSTFTDLIEARSNTPTKTDAINVQIGPGDPISNIPVVMEFEHHQVHEGESYLASLEQLSLGTGTVKFSVDVPANKYPHLIMSVDIYNGAALCRKYHTATYTGGSTMTAYNRNRNSANTPSITIKSGVTSSDGTLFESFFAGSGKTTSGGGRSMSEVILKAGSTYKFEVVGQDAQTKAVINFLWYEDLGV